MIKIIESVEEFEQIIKTDGVVLVDFYAEWCNPCKTIMKILDGFSVPNVAVCKIDIDKVPELKDRFGIRGIPTIMFFKNGKEVDRFTGLLPLGKIEERAKAVLPRQDVTIDSTGVSMGGIQSL